MSGLPAVPGLDQPYDYPKTKQRDQVQIDTVKEAFARMLADGITEVIVQPTHVIKGIENEQMMEEIRSFSEHFEKISVGRTPAFQ